jgi:hypothetical protein
MMVIAMNILHLGLVVTKCKLKYAGLWSNLINPLEPQNFLNVELRADRQLGSGLNPKIFDIVHILFAISDIA